jgi:transcriptional regulator
MDEKTGRTEKLIALLLIETMKGGRMEEKVSKLRIAGFTNAEIADLLGTTAAVVAQLHYVSKKGKVK